MRAARDGCKVINMSIGSPSSWTDRSLLDQVSDRLVSLYGMHVFVAQSNEGAEGELIVLLRLSVEFAAQITAQAHGTRRRRRQRI